MKPIKLTAKDRKVLGRKVKRLRAEGLIPANIFGTNVKSVSISVDAKEFADVFSKAGETGIIELDLDGKTRPCLVSNLQIHPVTQDYLHIDFYQVDLKKKVSAPVPFMFEGVSPAEKSGLGIVVTQMNEVEVEALPLDLPDHIVIDISVLEDVDNAIHIKDLKLDSSKLEIKADPDQIVVNVAAPQKEEEPEPVAEESEESGEAPAPEETSAESESQEQPAA